MNEETRSRRFQRQCAHHDWPIVRVGTPLLVQRGARVIARSVGSVDARHEPRLFAVGELD